MKLTNLRDLTEMSIFATVVKLIPAACLLFYVGTGMSNASRGDGGTHSRTEGHLLMEDNMEHTQDIRAHADDAYVLAGETETGIIIIGGGIMLMSNRKSPNKMKKQNSGK